jgi:quinol monooxygenase YgiN
MVIVGGTFEVEPDRREAFLAGNHELMRASRAEQGCLEYTFSADPLDPGRVLLFERWETQEDLDAHLARLRAEPKVPAAPVPPTRSTIVIYDAVETQRFG